MEGIKVIAFDADDTLWVNETFFREAEDEFAKLLEGYIPGHYINRELYKIEIGNLPIYGFGIKAFTLSMIETAMEITKGQVSSDVISKIIQIGKDMLNKPVVLMDGVEEVLQSLQGRYRLVLATKGDLLDQEKKLQKSGLEKYFHHIEILSDKQNSNYRKFIGHLDILPEEFLMIGNSLKSDVIPILELGGHAYHIPFHTTWDYERVDAKMDHPNFRHLDSIKDLLDIIKQ